MLTQREGRSEAVRNPKEVATFTWLSGDTERVEPIGPPRDGRQYVAWPDSRRVLEPYGMVERPSSWVALDRITDRMEI